MFVVSLFIYLKGRVRKKGKERQRKRERCHPLIHSSNAQNIQGCPRPKPAAPVSKSPTWVAEAPAFEPRFVVPCPYCQDIHYQEAESEAG